MTRGLFLLLLLINLGFYIWAHGYLGPRDDGHEPERLAAQLQAERMTVAVADAKAALGCRNIGPVPILTAEGVRTAVESAGGGAKASLEPVELFSYWVSIPPQSSKAAADRKADELKQLGVSDFYIVNDPGASRYSVSLGLFHSEDSANERLQQLLKKGVRSARIEPRPRPPEHAAVTIRGSLDFLNRQLPEILKPFSLLSGECAAQ